MHQNLCFVFFSAKNRVLKLRFLAFPKGPGGIRELREAYRNHFHLSWYRIVPGITSYDQKPTWGNVLPSTVPVLARHLKSESHWISEVVVVGGEIVPVNIAFRNDYEKTRSRQFVEQTL